MGDTVNMTDRQELLLAACREIFENGNTVSMRSIAKKHNVPRTTLQRLCKASRTAANILELTKRRGSPQRLTATEKALIAQTISEFQSRGAPLFEVSFLILR